MRSGAAFFYSACVLTVGCASAVNNAYALPADGAFVGHVVSSEEIGVFPANGGDVEESWRHFRFALLKRPGAEIEFVGAYTNCPAADGGRGNYLVVLKRDRFVVSGHQKTLLNVVACAPFDSSNSAPPP